MKRVLPVLLVLAAVACFLWAGREDDAAVPLPGAVRAESRADPTARLLPPPSSRAAAPRGAANSQGADANPSPVVETVRLEVIVEGPPGVGTAWAEIAVDGVHPDRPSVIADRDGRASLHVVPGEVTLEARAVDDRFRGWVETLVRPDADNRVRIVLEGPWEPILVRVLPSHAAIRVGTEARVRVSVGAARSTATAMVGGDPVEVLVPPIPPGESRPMGVAATMGPHGYWRGWATTGSEPSLRRWRQEPARVYVGAVAQVHLQVVQASGSPVEDLPVVTRGYTAHTDAAGHADLGRQHYGTMVIHVPGLRLDQLVVDAPWVNERFVVRDASPVGGAWRGPPIEEDSPFAVIVRADEMRFPARLEGARWSMTTALPFGAPVQVWVEAKGHALTDVLEVRTGRLDVDLAPVVATLRVLPRRGSAGPCAGTIRLTQGGGRGFVQAPTPAAGEPASVGPVRPGTWRVAFQPPGDTKWFEHPEPLELAPGDHEVEIDFGEPRPGRRPAGTGD